MIKNSHASSATWSQNKCLVNQIFRIIFRLFFLELCLQKAICPFITIKARQSKSLDENITIIFKIFFVQKQNIDKLRISSQLQMANK